MKRKDYMVYEVDLKIGQILGKEKTCDGKKKYFTKTDALKAQIRHNNDKRMHHKVHMYLCKYCESWTYHVGRRPTVRDVTRLFNYECSDEERECLLPLLDEWEKERINV
jgi:hypothetical protein